MIVNHTISTFLNLYKTGEITVDDLKRYYDAHEAVFEEYFMYHCPKTVERLTKAIKRYPEKLKDIETVSNILPDAIQDVINCYRLRFNFELHLNFHLFVGGFGSNAFVSREIIGQVFLAAEKLLPKLEHLRVIVAHEIGHIYHNVFIRPQWHGLA